MRKPTRRRFLASAGVGLPGSLLAATPGGAAGSSAELALPSCNFHGPPLRDARWDVRTLNSPRTPRRFTSRAEWEERAARLREQILAAAGLWPLPEKRPLSAEVFGRVEEDGYTVEKVFFESHPRFYCAGNLYRPRSGAHRAPYPAVLVPHGHWDYGRLEQNPNDPDGCATPQMCMNFALQGFVAFAIDMVGYNDSFQMPHRFGHDAKSPWALSPEALRLWLWGVSQLGLQLWNSIRALDFLSALPDVDGERLAVTGASGGGTQTFLLAAVDDRVKASAPVNMISHFMQGGCICENGPSLRIDTDNMEIGALSAPRPMLMVSATGDWTRDSERIEYPAVAHVYELFGARDHVSHVQFHNQHNFNRPSREAVYRFFAKWLPKQPRSDAHLVTEQGGFDLDPGRLLAFNRRLPPEGAFDTQSLTGSLVQAASEQLAAAIPKTRDEIELFRRTYEPVYRTALMVSQPTPDDLKWASAGAPSKPGTDYEALILSRKSVSDRVPALLAQPSGGARGAVLVIHPEGARAALGTASNPTPLAAALLRMRFRVGAIDSFQTGEARDTARKPEAEFFPCYNRTDAVERVQDILTALAWLEAAWKPERISVVGQGAAGLWCLLARPLFKKDYAVAADASVFDASKDESYLEKLYIPLLRRAGDFESAAWLAPASPLLVHNTGGRFSSDAFRQAFALRGASDRLRISEAALPASEISAWLSKG
jgi:dienelactone hydrolase